MPVHLAKERKKSPRLVAKKRKIKKKKKK